LRRSLCSSLFPYTTLFRSEVLDDLFEDHGAVGADGFNVSPERSSNDINMFGGDVFTSVQESYSVNFTLTLLEDDREAVSKTVFGDRKSTRLNSSHVSTSYA